jgi:hypothetical protein
VKIEEIQGTRVGCGGKVRGNSCAGCGADFLGASDIDCEGRAYQANGPEIIRLGRDCGAAEPDAEMAGVGGGA